MELLGVIGNPISHSLSPVMHSVALAEAKKQAIYLPFLVQAEGLAAAIKGAASLGFTGFNVTIPFKEQVVPLMTELTSEAKVIGAVNTIKFEKNGKIIGHNTDGQGFLASLADELMEPKDLNCLVIGAGGAARAIVSSLLSAGNDVCITNRTKERAEELAKDLNVGASEHRICNVVDLSVEGLKDVVAQVDLIVNTTSVGMAPNFNQSPIPLELVTSKHVVVDIIYNPEETLLLKHARQVGCKAQNGVGMLVWQAIKAWEFWWNETPPSKVSMFEAVQDALRKTSP